MAMALHTPADHLPLIGRQNRTVISALPASSITCFPGSTGCRRRLRHEMEVDQSRCDCSRTYPLLCSAGRVECLEDLPHRSITSRPSSILLFQKAAALHDLVLVMGQSELQPGLTPRGNVTVCRNGGLSQTDYTSKEFGENGDSSLPFIKD
jgi:hypothetical protein